MIKRKKAKVFKKRDRTKLRMCYADAEVADKSTDDYADDSYISYTANVSDKIFLLLNSFHLRFETEDCC